MKKLSLASLLTGLVVGSTLMVSCGGGGGGGGSSPSSGSSGSSSPTTPTGTGYFVDAPVQGLYYTTSSGISGYTGSNGSFSYDVGDSVTFDAGSTTLGSVTISVPSTTITPVSLFNDSVSSLSQCVANNLQGCNPNDYQALLTMQIIQTYGNCYSVSSTLCSITNAFIPVSSVSSMTSYSAYNTLMTNMPNLISANVALDNFLGISQTGVSFTAYVYSINNGDNSLITVYINGQPVTLGVDTGASGVIVNQSALGNAIPQSAVNTSQTWSVTYGGGTTAYGYMASVTVCMNPNIPQSCVIMPIGISTSGNSFPSSGQVQGDFGLDNSLNTQALGYSYNYYLMKQNLYYNGFELGWYSLLDGYWEPSASNPIGYIVFGNTNSFNPSHTISYSGSFPEVSTTFGSYINYSFFDTGSTFSYLSTSVLSTEIPNFSSSADEGNCNTSNWLQGGYLLSYSIGNFAYSFTTEPSSSSVCYSANLIKDVVFDVGKGVYGQEDFGLSEMLNHTFVWYLDTNPRDYTYGLVYQLGISNY